MPFVLHAPLYFCPLWFLFVFLNSLLSVHFRHWLLFHLFVSVFSFLHFITSVKTCGWRHVGFCPTFLFCLFSCLNCTVLFKYICFHLLSVVYSKSFPLPSLQHRRCLADADLLCSFAIHFEPLFSGEMSDLKSITKCSFFNATVSCSLEIGLDMHKIWLWLYSWSTERQEKDYQNWLKLVLKPLEWHYGSFVH